MSVVSALITISGKLFHTFTILGAKGKNKCQAKLQKKSYDLS